MMEEMRERERDVMECNGTNIWDIRIMAFFSLSKLSKIHETIIMPGTQSNVPLQGKNKISVNINYKERN